MKVVGAVGVVGTMGVVGAVGIMGVVGIMGGVGVVGVARVVGWWEIAPEPPKGDKLKKRWEVRAARAICGWWEFSKRLGEDRKKLNHFF